MHYSFKISPNFAQNIDEDEINQINQDRVKRTKRQTKRSIAIFTLNKLNKDVGVDISSFSRGSQCILGSLGGKQSFFRSRLL